MDLLTTLGLFLTAASILFGVYVFRRQMNAQPFLEYTKRYEEVMRSYPGDLRSARLHTDGEPPPESTELTAVVLKYLNLCSEEFYLWKRGYLSTDIWRIWEGEMLRTMASPLYRREWPKLRAEFAAYDEFASYVESAQVELS